MSDTSPEPSLESLRPKGPLTAPKPEPPADAPDLAPAQDPTIEHLVIGHAHFYLRYANLLPPLTAEEYDGLRASIEAHGIQQAIVVHRLTRTHIDVVDGAHRLRIAHELGLDLAAIPLNFLMVATSEDDQRALAWSLNADRRHLTKEQRQQRAVELRQQGKSYRAIGEQLGVDPMTARSDVQKATVENSTVQLPERVVSKDGKERPATAPTPSEDEVQTAREFIIDALRKKYSPLARGQLYRDASRIAGASGIKRAAFDAALDAMLEAGSVREHLNAHGAREYHFADVVDRLEQRAADSEKTGAFSNIPKWEPSWSPMAPEPPAATEQGGAEQGGESAAPEMTEAPVQTSAPAPEPPAANGDMGVHYSSKSSEWYTPPDLLERVITVLGPIELDPCSNSHDAPNVPAQRHFTREDDGLAQSWASAALFMNPPYGSEIGPWVEKLAADYEEHHVGAAIALLPARTDTAWFRRLSAYPRCFIFGRLKFVSPESGEENPAPFPSMAVYLGPDAGAFQRAFAEIGDVFIRWDLRFRWGVGAETA